MQKEKRSALLRFLLSVAAVVIGTAILGTMVSGKAPQGEFGRGQQGQFGGRGQGQFNRQPGTNSTQAPQGGQP